MFSLFPIHTIHIVTQKHRLQYSGVRSILCHNLLMSIQIHDRLYEGHGWINLININQWGHQHYNNQGNILRENTTIVILVENRQKRRAISMKYVSKNSFDSDLGCILALAWSLMDKDLFDAVQQKTILKGQGSYWSQFSTIVPPLQWESLFMSGSSAWLNSFAYQWMDQIRKGSRFVLVINCSHCWAEDLQQASLMKASPAVCTALLLRYF